ncbi:MAG: hypothetical protein AB7T27_01275 [Kiritimatiellia bacterium]
MSDPRKDLRKRTWLSILLPLAVLTMLYRMGLSPFTEGRRTAQSSLEHYTRKIQEAKPVLDVAQQRVDDELKLDPRLRKILQTYVYESEDQLTEVTLKLDDFARSSGMKVLSVRPTRLAAASWMEDREKKYAFKPICVTVNGAGNYDQIHKFVGLVEGDSPFATLSFVSIAGIKDDPNDMTATLQIEWPIWTEIGRTEYLPMMQK